MNHEFANPKSPIFSPQPLVPNPQSPVFKSSTQNFETEVSSPKSKIVNRKLEYGFKVASYDKTTELVIDPLLASTFLDSNRGGYSLALGTNGDVYVTTGSSISKLDSELTSLLSSAYLGGSGYSITIDTGGNVYVTGSADPDFSATDGAYDTFHNGDSDVFVAKLDGSLTNLVASTLLGGSDREIAYSIALDPAGNVYVTGKTKSPDFPVTSGAYDASGNTSAANNYDAFVSKLSGDLSNLLASTFLGGAGDECAYTIVLDSVGNIYVAGETGSSDFPATSGAYDTSYNGSSYNTSYTDYEGYNGDAFVTKMDGNLSNLLASTFLGGSGNDHARSLAIDISGNIYTAGFTSSSDFPTTSGAYDTSGYASDSWYYDAFITKLSGDLSSLLASTYLGGDVSGRDKDSGRDYAWSIAIDLNGDVYVTGNTDSSSFPTTPNAYDITGPTESGLEGSVNVIEDAFVSKLDSDLSSLLASTFLGGNGEDYGRSLVIDSVGNVYVAGYTDSSDFPTTDNAYNTSFSGGVVFISKFDSDLSADAATSPTPTPTVTVTPTPTPADEPCKAKTITTDPEKILVIERNQSDTVTVSVLGKDGCPVEGAEVKARLNRSSKKKISVTSGAITDADGKATFTVTAYNKKGTAKIVFSPKGLKKKAKLKVKIE